MQWHDLLYTVTDDGIAHTYDALHGRSVARQRLRGNYKASPLAAEGRIYYLNTEGLCTVLAADQRGEKLAENQLDDSTLASPAVAGRHLFIRGRRALYCIGRATGAAN